MRGGIDHLNPVRLEDAPCGCERWEYDAAVPAGGKTRSVTTFHDCGLVFTPRGPRRRDPSAPQQKPERVRIPRDAGRTATPKRPRNR